MQKIVFLFCALTSLPSFAKTCLLAIDSGSADKPVLSCNDTEPVNLAVPEGKAPRLSSLIERVKTETKLKFTGCDVRTYSWSARITESPSTYMQRTCYFTD